MSISEEVEQKIIGNNSKISELLLENENLLRIEGLNIPEQNFALTSDDKIKVPRGYKIGRASCRERVSVLV